MAEQDIHEPQLPGVKTFARDSAEDTPETESTLGVSFFGKTKTPMTTPETSTFKEPNNSILTNRDDVFNVSHAFSENHIETGTIVTDKRQSHRSLGGTLTAALSEWWGNTSSKLQSIDFAQKPERPTVPKAETRKEVIAEAAQHTRQVPRDDHTVVVEKLKTLSHDAERITGKPYVIKKPVEKTAAELQRGYSAQASTQQESASITDSHRTPTLDLRQMAVAPTVPGRVNTEIPHRETTPSVTPAERPAPAQHTEETLVRATVTPEVAHQQEAPVRHGSEWKFFSNGESPKVPEPVAPTISTPHVPEQIIVRERVPEPVITVSERSVEIPPALRPRIETAPPHIETPTPRPHISSPELRAPQKEIVRHRRIIPALIFTLVIIIGAGGGIFAGMYVSKQRGAVVAEPTGGAVVPLAYFAPDRTLPLALVQPKEVLMQGIMDTVQGSESGITQIYLVAGIASKTNTAILTTAQVFDALQPRVDTRFIRALDDTIMLGSVHTEKSEPFLVLKSNNFDTAFAGMLDWEEFMRDDLAPLFGTPITESESTMRFTDALAQNRSIRILRDTEGNEVIIYAFVSRDTIVITSSTAALSAIVGRI